MRCLVTGAGRSGTNWVTEIVRCSNVFNFTKSIEDRRLFKRKSLKPNYATKLATENKGFNKQNIKQLLNKYDDFKILFVTRHPIDNCMSKIVRGQPKSQGGDKKTENISDDGTPIKAIDAVNYSAMMYKYIKEYNENIVMQVKLEDLIDNTKNTIQSICNFLNIEFKDEMLGAHLNNRNKYQKKRYKKIDKSQKNLRDRWQTTYNGFFKNKMETMKIIFSLTDKASEIFNYE